MKIRRAELKDCYAIQQLNNELFDLELNNSDPYLIKDWPLSDAGKEYFEDAIRNDYVVVAEVEGKIVGYLLGSISDIPYYAFKVAELCNMCVNANYRKLGIGKMLYNSFVDYYKGIGVNHFMVTASYKNENARKFYKAIGFEEGNVTYIKF